MAGVELLPHQRARVLGNRRASTRTPKRPMARAGSAPRPGVSRYALASHSDAASGHCTRRPDACTT